MKKITRFPAFPAGLLVLAAALFAGTGTISHLSPPSEPIPPSLFGMHIHHAADKTPWPAVPVPEWRLWDAYVQWPQLEPKMGRWNFAILDRDVSMAQEHNVDVLLPLGLSPPWASARPQEKSVYQPGFAAEPSNLEYWRNYVAKVAARYKGRVHSYEIWNEPNSKGFWTGDVNQMVTLTQQAYEIIHRIDPSAQVVSPAATTEGGVPWLEQFLHQGGGQYVDVIGYHFYVSPQPPEAMVPLIQKVRQVMMEAGVGNKPLWNTESGWPAPKPFPSPELGAAYLVRAYVLNWAMGVQRFYWYSWDNHTFASIEVTERDNQTPTPAGRAFGVVQDWLVGAEMKRCDEDADHTWICELTREGSPRWIVWNPTGAKTIPVPQEWHAKNFTVLLQGPSPIMGPRLEVSQIPELVTGPGR